MMPIWLGIVLGIAMLAGGASTGCLVLNAINNKSMQSAKSKTKEIKYVSLLQSI